ncbi:winged helix-turn-helix transcriptional regulator [Chryseobacterium sp.]|uniref:winged helix-turn-helix transcriptional regulator n=1 Tax=Chryseobacterium sp. TaxID=1871047 RepID=UPI0012AA071C|nr:helix-turn-helix domain-containing protein [Chryseobacterium sp.]QFG52729.1 helix-turn-helix transcriptional regulator [Chryseobacterium sp.]
MKNYRSLCPLARGLDVFGDKWTLLILRDIAFYGKTTFGELSRMEEGIASNTLAQRLEKLVNLELLTKTNSETNKLIYHYRITEKGLDLIPVLQNILQWSEKHLFERMN